MFSPFLWFFYDITISFHESYFDPYLQTQRDGLVILDFRHFADAMVRLLRHQVAPAVPELQLGLVRVT